MSYIKSSWCWPNLFFLSKRQFTLNWDVYVGRFRTHSWWKWPHNVGVQCLALYNSYRCGCAVETALELFPVNISFLAKSLNKTRCVVLQVKTSDSQLTRRKMVNEGHKISPGLSITLQTSEFTEFPFSSFGKLFSWLYWTLHAVVTYRFLFITSKRKHN